MDPCHSHQTHTVFENVVSASLNRKRTETAWNERRPSDFQNSTDKELAGRAQLQTFAPLRKSNSEVSSWIQRIGTLGPEGGTTTGLEGMES